MTIHRTPDQIDRTKVEVSQHFPPFIRAALVGAAAAHWQSEAERIATIDSITDDLARQGYCRPREDNSRAAEWAQGRAPR
jgi:hypothetical protein